MATKARLRPLLGKTAADQEFVVEGVLTVTAVVAPPKLADLIAIADARRPDLQANLTDIEQKRAQWELERRRAKPEVAVTPGWSYQNQQAITGFRNGSLFDIALTTTLPITDRNQGNIRKAQSLVQEARHTYRGNRADALAEIETALGDYEEAIARLAANSTTESRNSPRDLRERMTQLYGAGQRTLLDYLSAQQAYRQRLERIAEAEANYWRKLNNLNAVIGGEALGGGGPWEPPPTAAGRQPGH